MADVTLILQRIEEGDSYAARNLLPLVYEELRRLAAARMAQEQPGQTLQATALVHEAYLRLVDTEQAARWNSRGHFFAAAAEAMRRILVENARRKGRQKHGGGRCSFALAEGDLVSVPVDAEVLDLDDALSRLEQSDHQLAELVKVHVFAGMTFEDAADLFGISVRQAKRDWAYARAWLARDMGGPQRPAS